MTKKKHEQASDAIENVEEVLSRSEQFIEDNQKTITTVIVVIIAIVGIYMGYKKYIQEPEEGNAQSQMFVAAQYFERDSFNLALNGDVNYPGFLAIIDDYSGTKAANLAKYYAGISYLHLGDFQEAIDYLEDFKSDDKMLKPIATGAIGDAYMELDNKAKAAKYYKKAAETAKNDFTSPIYLMKAAQAFELLGNYKEALTIYQEIKKDYKNSAEGRVIDKYITRAENKLK
jgi:tetratricopeptide (TPR) repeat protein